MKCLLCGSTNAKIFKQMEYLGFPVVYYQCQECGLIFQSASESRASDGEFYRRTYRKLYQENEQPTEKDLWVQTQRAEKLIGLILSQTESPPRRVLDIGASTGVFLKTCQEVFNAEVVGVEPGDAYRRFAENQGLTMYSFLEKLIEVTPAKFDLVSMIHVLEHLPDPLGFLKEVRNELLVPNGFLLLEVPNFYAHESYELAHLSCFTPHTFQEIIKRAGFQVLSYTRSGQPRSALLNLYLTIIAKPLLGDSPISPIKQDRFVLLKRQIGFLYRRVVQKVFPDKAWLSLPGKKGIDQCRS